MCCLCVNDESAVKLQRGDKALSLLEPKRKNLTDMLLDDKITKDENNGSIFPSSVKMMYGQALGQELKNQKNIS